MHAINKWNREQTKHTAQFQKPLDKFVETEPYSIHLTRIWMIAHWSAWHMYGNEKWRNYASIMGKKLHAYCDDVNCQYHLSACGRK